MKRKFLIPLFAVCAAAALSFGCSNGSDTETTGTASLAISSSVLVIPDAVATVTTSTLTASLSGSDSSLKWTSSDATVVSVAGSGSTAVLTAMGAGSARVLAATSDGKLSASCKITVTLGQTAAHPVTDLAVSSSATNSVTLTWTDSSDLTSVKIVCYKTSDLSTVVSTTNIEKGIQTAVISGLSTDSSGISYTFHVYGVVNTSVVSEVSAVTGSTVADTTPPANVTSLAVSSHTDHTAVLTWTDPSDDDFDHVLITSSNTLQDGSAFADITVASGTGTATISKLSSGTEYTFTVKTVDVNSNVSSSDLPTATVTTDADSTAPGSVTGLTAAGGRTSVKLTWTDPSDADLKNIVIAASSSTSGATVPSDATITAGTQTATISGLTLGASYTFVLTTNDYSGYSGTSVSVDVATINPVPTNVAAVTNYSAVVVTWTDTTAAEDGITYTYKAVATPATTSNGETVVTQTGIATGTQIAVFTSLTAGTSYTFSVVTTPSDSGTYEGNTVAVAAPSKIYWRIYNTYSLAGVSDTSYMLVPNIENSTYEVAIGTATERSGKSITYEYWLKVPDIADPTSTTYFSLEALDASKAETGYYMYLDPTRSLPSTALQYGKWSYSSSSVKYASFVAKPTDSYLSSNLSYAAFKLKSDTKTVNTYTCKALEWGYDSSRTLYATYLNTFGATGYTTSSGDYFWYISETN